MKRALLLVSIIFIIQSTIFPQEVKTIAQEAFIQETIQEKSYPIPGSHLLREKEQKILEYFKQHPDAKRFAKPRSTAWNFTVGSTYDWWADSLTDTGGQYQVPSTCRAVGTNCYVFVEDTEWGTDRVDQDAVNAIVEAFDNSTPADAPNNDGIYNVDTRIFGAPPDVDNDPRIILLILDIRDGWDGSGSYVAGYFYSANEYPDGDPALEEVRSNYTEIFYMDCNPADLITDRTDVLNTIAHEFQHMIHWQHDIGEMTFVNEGLSEIASYICGYGLRSNGRYTQNTNVNLLSWDGTGDVLDDYSRAAFWTLYIYEQFPIGILKDFVNNHHSYWGDFDITFHAHDANRGFFNVFEEWLIANYVNGNSADAKYMYQYSPLSKPAPVATYIGNPNGIGSGTLVPFGAEYIKFSGGSDLTITFSGDNGIKIYALKIGSSLEVKEVTRDVPYSPGGFSTTYPEVTFLVYNQIQSIKNYSYVSTGTAIAGTMELAYDDGEPEGYLKVETGDSSAVFFSGISGAKLDSIRVAFRRSGNIQMDISELDGTAFLRGANLYGPVQINSPDSTASTPYPVPYDNWVTVDLTNDNIDATNDFIVSFLIGSNPAEPGIMVSSEPDDGVRHSRTYVKSDDTWHSYGVQGSPGNIWNYLIRAYVSIGGTTVLAQPTINSIVANQGNVQLSWNSSAGPVEGYNIYRSTSTGFTPDNNNIIGNVGSTITTYTDALPNIQANTDYYYRLSSFDGSGNESDYSEEVTTRTLDVKDKNGIPTEYSLNSNYPNPFNPSTTFRFSTPKDGLVKFTVHDLLGRVVYSENRNLFAGNYSFTWEGNNMLNQQVVSGVYFLRMETEGFSQTRKMLLLR